MVSEGFTPHPHLKDLPRGFTIQAYESLDETERHRFLDYIPPQRTPTGGWFDLARLFQKSKFAYSLEGDRFFLGFLDGQPVGHRDDRHILLTAASRSGKGVSHILPNLIYYRGSCLVLDPKGELANKTARRRGNGSPVYDGLGQSVRILDPFCITEPHVAEYLSYYNVFEDILAPDAPDLRENAELVADAIVIPEPGGDSHWTDTARQLIAGIVLHLATYPVYNPDLNAELREGIASGDAQDPRHLVTAYHLLMQGTVPRLPHGDIYQPDPGKEPLSGLEGLFQEMALNPEETVRFAALDIARKPPNERGSVISTACRHMHFLSSKAMQRALAPSTATQGKGFRLSELKTDPAGLTLYLCLPSIRLATHRAFFRLFVNLAFAAIEQLGEKVPPAVQNSRGEPIKTMFLLDEFHIMGPMKIVMTAAPLFASYGCQMVFCVQDLNQLKGLYSDQYQSLMGNCGTTLWYNNPDPFTLGVIEAMLGKTSIVANRYGHVSLDALSRGGQAESRSLETHPLLTGEEIRRHFARDKDNVLIITPEERPLVLRRIKAYDPASRNGLRSLYDADGKGADA